MRPGDLALITMARGPLDTQDVLCIILRSRSTEDGMIHEALLSGGNVVEYHDYYFSTIKEVQKLSIVL